MDNDQIQKKVEWLDKERLEDKKTILELQKQIETLEAKQEEREGQIKDLESQVSRLGVNVEKVDKFESTITQQSSILKKELEDLETKRNKREKEAEKKIQQELIDIRNTFQVFKSGLEDFNNLNKDISSTQKEVQRLGQSITQVEEIVDVIRKAEEKHLRVAESIEERERRDAKRMADLQKETAGFNKRAQEIIAKFEIIQIDHKKFDVRLNEVLSAEKQRDSEQVKLKEEVTRNQNDRNRQWKDWEKRFTTIEEQSNQITTHLKNISEVERALDKAKASFEQISDQINRRINEITEMQRLGEERFRQDIATFKVDDQKRWTNYSLTQEEMLGDVNRRMEKISSQSTKLADTVQDLQEIVQHITEQMEKRMHSLIESLRDWAEEDDRFLSGQR